MQCLKIIVSGEGGQGIQTIAKILQRAAFNNNKETLYVPNFGVEQRGGVSIAYLQISDEKIYYPKFQTADIAAVLSGRSVERVRDHIGANTLILYNSSLIKKINLKARALEPVDATNIALSNFSPKVFNMIILGRLLKYFSFLSREDIIRSMEDEMGEKFRKNNNLRLENIKALEYSE